MSDDTLFRQIIIDLPRGASILDLGSGNGAPRPTGRPARYAKALGSAGFAVTAVDRRPGVGLPWPGVEYLQTSIEEFCAGHRRPFDLVICSNCLHFLDPANLRLLPDFVAPQGQLFVRTFADQLKVLEGLRQLEQLALVKERAYTLVDHHPPEGEHTHNIVEMVFCRRGGEGINI